MRCSGEQGMVLFWRKYVSANNTSINLVLADQTKRRKEDDR